MDILLVEDSGSDAFLLQRIFAMQEKAPKVHWVRDGYNALDYVFRRKAYHAAARPDVIVLDLNLPRINGYEVLKDIKQTPELAAIPIIVLTTSINPLDLRQCKALGADICLSKPYSLKGYEEIARRVVDWTVAQGTPAEAGATATP